MEKNKKLSDLILLAGGFVDGIKKVNISMARVNPNSFSPVLYNIPSKTDGEKFINISSLETSNNKINNFNLMPNDIINIYPDPRDKLPGSVYITGAVQFPGDYPVLSSKERVSDIIIRAGGLLPEAYPLASSFIRAGQTIQLSFEEIIKNPNSKENFEIMTDDSINIQLKPNIIRIIGEVNNPGTFKYFQNYTLRDYIRISGGFTVNAESKEIWLTYPDGTSRQLKSFLPAPKVYDGSVITIGREEESEPLNKTEFAKEIASIISDFLQIALTLIIISNTSSG